MMYSDDLEIIEDILDLFKVDEKRPFTSHDDTVLLNPQVSSSTTHDAHGISKKNTKGIFHSESLWGSRDDSNYFNYFTPVCGEHNLQRSESKTGQKKKKRGRPRRDPGDKWPKRPLSAYNLFFKDEQLRLSKIIQVQANDRLLCKEVPAGEVANSRTKTVASKWRALSDEEKSSYKIKAVEQMKKYREQVAAIMKNKRHKYGLSIDDNTHEDMNSRNEPILENKSPINTEPTQKFQTPLSGYSIFFQHERERRRHCLLAASTPGNFDSNGQVSLEGNDNKSLVQEIQTIDSTWEKMSEEERSFYRALEEFNFTTYKKEMKRFR